MVYKRGAKSFSSIHKIFLSSLLYNLLISDDLAYQTESEKKSYGGGGGVAHRGSSKNRGHQSDLDEKNQGMYNCTLRKSKFFIEKKTFEITSSC